MGEQLPYYSLNNFFRQFFGQRVYKIPLAVPFNCPNRDGTKGEGGCTYCNNRSFNPLLDHGVPPSIETQLQQGIERLGSRYKVHQFLAYFQTYTSTYAPLSILRQHYEQALAPTEIIGLAIGTRPDCVPSPVLELLAGYARKYHVWIEYGLQSMHDHTLTSLHRGHSVAEFDDAVWRTHEQQDIFICVHVILGLPGETQADMLATARYLATLPIDGIKLHHLSITRDTALATSYARQPFALLSPAQYVPLVVSFLEELPPWIVVQRLCGECRRDLLIAPDWPRDKSIVRNAVIAEFQRRGSYQGRHYLPRLHREPKLGSCASLRTRSVASEMRRH